MSRPELEVAEIFRRHGAAWREANRGHVSLEQLKVMSAIERCRTAALGGHVARCENGACGHTIIAYCSCRNRHCPKCQAAASREWLGQREVDQLPSRPAIDQGRCPNVPTTRPSRCPQPWRPASIPIEPAAPSTPTSRDFVPWRFSDAGLQCVATSSRAGVRETCTIASVAD